MNKEPFITPYVKFELKEGLLYVTYLPGAVINIDVAKEIVKQRIEYTKGASYLCMISGEGLKAIDKEARDYFSNEGTSGLLAGAFVIYSVYTEFFGNFFLRISKPPIPSKLFIGEQEALKWLEQFKAKS